MNSTYNNSCSSVRQTYIFMNRLFNCGYFINKGFQTMIMKRYFNFGYSFINKEFQTMITSYSPATALAVYCTTQVFQFEPTLTFFG